MGSEQQVIRVFSVRGVPVRVHPAMLAVVAGLLLAELLIPGTSRALRFALGLLVLMLSVLAHELGHAVAARALGIHVADITFHLLFAVCRTAPPPSPRREVVVACGGPLANLLIAALVLGVRAAVSPPPGVLAEVLDEALLFNLALGLANLVPAFPMDGGRVLRAALETRLGFLRATRAAVVVGRVLAGATLLAPLVLGVRPETLIAPLAGLVVLVLGEAEWRRARRVAAAAGD